MTGLGLVYKHDKVLKIELNARGFRWATHVFFGSIWVNSKPNQVFSSFFTCRVPSGCERSWPRTTSCPPVISISLYRSSLPRPNVESSENYITWKKVDISILVASQVTWTLHTFEIGFLFFVSNSLYLISSSKNKENLHDKKQQKIARNHIKIC